MQYTFELFKSDNPNKKYKVIIYENGIKKKTINFGDSRYKDFIEYNKIDKNLANERKQRYIQRHSNNENWTKSGIFTAGWWSKWMLWNLSTLQASYNDIKRRFF